MRVTRLGNSLLAAATFVLLLGFAWDSRVLGQDTQVKVDKKQEEIKLQKSDQFAADQAKAINHIPGANVKAEDLKETTVKKKASPGLNPFGWLFRPLTRLQEQSLRLEQQMMKLTGPIAALQPGMLRLEKRMVSVEAQTGKVQDQMRLMQTDISAMRSELGEIKKPIMELREPIVALRDPLQRIEKPVTSVNKDITELKTLLSLVLTSIYVAAAVIAFGTPLAAILIWRNKHKLLKPAKPDENDEEEAVSARPRAVDNQFRKSA